jgi:glycosyltransferase involved in cell wall biosynthesis
VNSVRERKCSILWIDHTIPDVNRDAGSVRAIALMEIATELGCEIVFASDISVKDDNPSCLVDIGVEICESIEVAVQHLNIKYDFVWISRINVIHKHYEYIKIHLPKAKIIFDTVDLHGLRMLRESGFINNQVNRLQAAKKTLQNEIHYAEVSDSTLVVSEFEFGLLKDFGISDKVTVVSTVHSPTSNPPIFASTKGLVFIGGFNHQPNVSAVNWFVECVWPLLPNSIKDQGFTIAGSNMPDQILRLSNGQIFPLGWVKDSGEIVKQHRVSIAPLRYGAGVKGKVGEAFAAGVPVVLTGVASEGMHVVQGEHALIADNPADFAKAIERLYLDEQLWYQLQASALRLIETYFSKAETKTKLEVLFLNLTPYLEQD